MKEVKTMSFDISVLPKEEGKSFLVLAPDFDYPSVSLVWQQVSWFEGNLYPDVKGYNLNYTDSIDLEKVFDYAELPKENKQMKTQETIQAWVLKFNEGLSVQNIFRTRKEAREMSKELEEDFGDTSKVVKVQIQVLN